jgi:hypothetical protein
LGTTGGKGKGGECEGGKQIFVFVSVRAVWWEVFFKAYAFRVREARKGITEKVWIRWTLGGVLFVFIVCFSPLGTRGDFAVASWVNGWLMIQT